MKTAGDELYRVEHPYLGDPRPILKVFRIEKVTACGYWIRKFEDAKLRFVLDDQAGGRRYAYTTKEAALRSFKIRIMKRLEHLWGDFVITRETLQGVLPDQVQVVNPLWDGKENAEEIVGKMTPYWDRRATELLEKSNQMDRYPTELTFTNTIE